MKLPLYILLGALGTLSLHGQSPTAEADAIKSLTKKIEEIEAQRKADNAKLDDRIDALTKSADEEAQERYELFKTELMDHYELLKGLNQKLLLLESKTASAKLTNYVGKIQNPTSTDLGFNLQDVLTKAIKEFRFGSVREPRTLTIMNSIMNSPIFKSVATSNPVAATLVSVMELVRGVAFVDNKTEKLDAFEAEISKYIAFYTVMSEGVTAYDFALRAQSIELSALHNKIRQQAEEFASAIGCEVHKATKEESTREHMNHVFAKLDRKAVENFIKKQEKEFKDKDKGTVNYRSILAPRDGNALLVASGVARTSADLVEQLQVRKKLWDEAQANYCKKVDTALDLASSRNIGNREKIAAAKTELANLRTEDEETVTAAMDLDELVKLSQSIKRPK